jgi:flagellin-like hook-associated protein FlgL
MSIKLYLVATAAAAMISGPIASAQTLGDVAKKEEARRKDVKTPAKVYTNDNLKSDAGSTPLPPATPAAGAASTQVPPSPSGVAPKDGDKPAVVDDSKKDEASWRSRIDQARTALDRAKTFAEALQSRINALTTDFSARSDPAQRAVIGADRQKALAELDRVQKEIQADTKAIADIQEEARKAAVPPGWVR